MIGPVDEVKSFPVADLSPLVEPAQAEINLVALINNSARKGNWRAAAWMLERRFPARWGRKTYVGIGEINPDELTDEELETIISEGMVHGDI